MNNKKRDMLIRERSSLEVKMNRVELEGLFRTRDYYKGLIERINKILGRKQ